MRRLFVFLLVLAVSVFFSAHLTASQTYAPLGANTLGAPSPKSLTGSYVVFYPDAGGEECYMAGVTADFVFYAESNSPDWEYAYEFWLQFPADWVVNGVSFFGQGCDGTGTWGSFDYTVQATPNVVRVYHPRYHASSGDTCGAFYTVNATPGAAIGNAIVSWYWDGDGYASTPHWPCSDDGYTPPGMDPCDEMIHPPASIPPCAVDPGVYLFPEVQTNADCPGSTLDYTVTLLNLTGATATISLDYAVTTGNGSASGPPSLTLDEGEMQDFTASLTSNPGLSAGDIVSATITATQNSYSDTAIINMEITLGGWVNIATEPGGGRMDNVVVTYNGQVWSIAGYGGDLLVHYYDPASDSWTTIPDSSFYDCYARSGAAHGNKAYIYGDATTGGFTGLWSYNMDTNTWTNESPSGTAPAQTGIWAPAWVADPDTGYLYMTGGATTPGGGNLTTVYVYDPVSNAWLAPLPNFTSNRAFHGAFIFNHPTSGNKMLAVVGGVNSGGTLLASTQCYDFTTGTWNAENADIPAVPGGRWGFGYAHNTVGADNHFWLIGGIDTGGDMIADSVYFDLASGTWNDGGVYHATPVFRTSATALGGEVYKISGSSGGFSPTGLSSKFFLCSVEEYPDASINASDISFSPDLPMPGDMVEITARIYNVGTQSISSGVVDFYYSLEPGVDLQLIDWVALGTIPPSGYLDATIYWNTDPAMDPTIYIITVNIRDILPEEVNLANNTAYIELPLPVELGYFTATGLGNRVNVSWMTITETDNLGFNLYRLRGDKVSPYISFFPVKLNTGLIQGQGTSSTPETYSFTDYVKSGGNYIYILECISTSGIATEEYRTRLEWLF